MMRKQSLVNRAKAFIKLDKHRIGASTQNIAVGCGERHLTIDELKKKLEDREGALPRFDNRCFHEENLWEDIDLSRVILHNCCFYKVKALKVNFRNSDLSDSDFRQAHLEGVDFAFSDLTNANLSMAKLSNVNFTNTILLHTKLHLANFDRVIFNNTQVGSDSFGNILLVEKESRYLEASTIYRSLRKNFEEVGDYDSASWAYLRERVTKYKSFGLRHAYSSYGSPVETPNPFLYVISAIIYWFTSKSWLNWITGFFQHYLWGFAQKPFWVLGWGTIIISVFSIIYWQSGLIVSVDRLGKVSNTNFMDCLLFSTAAFSTSSVSGLEGRIYQANMLASIEGILGVVILALFTTSLAKKLGGI